MQMVLAHPDTKKYVSRISFWELSIKTSLKKLDTIQSPAHMFEQIQMTDAILLGIEATYLTKLESLPFHHRDPFDRLLIATAIAEGLTLISADRHFRSYEGLALLWD